MIISAGNNETFDFALPIGVGLVESAMNLTRLLLLDPPKYLLFIGSAGSYGKHNIFDIVESKVSSQLELSFLEKNSFTPIDNMISSEFELVEQQSIVNSSNYISINFELSKKFNNYNIGIENMEFYSVLRIAQEFNIPCGGIFVITNYCNESAHQDFLDNHKEAMDRLTKHLLAKGILNEKNNF